MRANVLCAGVLFVLGQGWAGAEVVDSSSNGFTVKTTLAIQATPADVYRRLVHNVGDWWDSEHTYSGNSHNLSIDEKPMGCFCEKLANRGGVRHMEVVRFDPGKTLVMTGGLGPLQSMAASANMTIQLSPAAGATKLEMTFAVTGYAPGGMNTLAAPVDSVLQQQFTRLKNYVEHGDPKPKTNRP